MGRNTDHLLVLNAPILVPVVFLILHKRAGLVRRTLLGNLGSVDSGMVSKWAAIVLAVPCAICSSVPKGDNNRLISDMISREGVLLRLYHY